MDGWMDGWMDGSALIGCRNDGGCGEQEQEVIILRTRRTRFAIVSLQRKNGISPRKYPRRQSRRLRLVPSSLRSPPSFAKN